MTITDVIERWCTHGGHMAETGDPIYRQTDGNGAVVQTVCYGCVLTEWGRAEFALMQRRLKDYWGEEAA